MSEPVTMPFHDGSARGRLLQAAVGLFNQRGYAPTTVREIVDAAGVTKPVLYYYFGSKEGIFQAIMDESYRIFRQELEEPYPGATVRERIIAFAQRVLALSRANISVVRLIHAVFYGPREGAPPFECEKFHDAFTEQLQRLVSEGVASAELRSDNLTATVLALLGAINVCLELELAHPEQAVSQEGVAATLNVVFDGAAMTRERKE